MPKIGSKLLILLGAIGSIGGAHADCPELSSKDLGYYICPGIGTAPAPLVGLSAMEYSRVTKDTQEILDQLAEEGAQTTGLKELGDSCMRIVSFISKSVKTKTYPGVESNVETGKLACRYTLEGEWRGYFGIEQFGLVSQDIMSPPRDIRNTFCPSLSADTIEEMRSKLNPTKLQFDDIIWEIPSADRAGVFNILSKKGVKPKGEIKGVLDQELSKPYKHQCTYNYHVFGNMVEKTDVLQGAMRMSE